MNRHALPVAGALAGLLLWAPAPAGAQESPAREGPRTVPDFTTAFVSAVRDWNVEAWAELVADDVVMMAPNGRIVEGREAFRDLWTRTFEGRTGVNPLKVVLKDVRSEGDLAVVRADYGPEGREPVGQYVWTLERDERGTWSLAWWIFNRRGADSS